jgi:hypothetical protein
MKTNIIYLMGAGRSGTTALATFLGNSHNILSVGEMHQFFEHIEHNKPCSCGALLSECDVWSRVLARLPHDYLDNPGAYKSFCDDFEYHKAVPKYLLRSFKSEDIHKYTDINEIVFQAIEEEYQKSYILDSAKYIGRALGLSKSNKINIKIIYVIRDVRGVISSFTKSVQTSRTPLSTIVYWTIVNIVAEFVYRVFPKGSVIKLKYEDLIDEPIREFERLEKFLGIDLGDVKEKVIENQAFDMPHIIGGNRMKSNKQIYFRKDASWRDNFPRSKKWSYYLLASPLMLLNKFKI